MSRSAWALLPLCFITGCTLLLGYGDEVSLAPDGGVVEPDGDAPVSDAADTTDAADTPFCDSLVPQPTFCASFDQAGLFAEWSETRAENVLLERDTTLFRSAPASLRVAFDRTNSGGISGGCTLSLAAWEGRPFTMTMAFDLRVEAADPPGAVAVISNPLLLAAPTYASYIIQLLGRPLADGTTVGLSLVEVTNNPSASREIPSTVSVQKGTWSRVELTFESSGARAVRLSVEGRPGLDSTLQLNGGGTPFSDVGISTVASETTAWDYRVDNVVVDVR